MYVLGVDQIENIKERIAFASLKDASLSIDILDHICCMIEERLELGFDYTKAEKEVFNQMGVLQIQAIEQETILLTQNKITMKKRTKIIGLVAMVLMALGFSLKMLHIPGAAVTWAVGVIVAVFGFAILMVVDQFSYEKTARGRMKAIVGFLGVAFFIAGIGSKVLHLPGAFAAATLGAGLLLVYYILSNLISNSETTT